MNYNYVVFKTNDVPGRTAPLPAFNLTLPVKVDNGEDEKINDIQRSLYKEGYEMWLTNTPHWEDARDMALYLRRRGVETILVSPQPHGYYLKVA
jgi:hypothetical protein